MGDILFKTEDWVFSYRVAGICVHDGKVLLQTTTGEDKSFAFPGGHVEFGETNAQTLVREFREEIGADISVGELKWVAENFFPWGDKPCQQICCYFLVHIEDDTTPRDGVFRAKEPHLEFHWVPIGQVGEMEVYPTNAKELLKKLDAGVQHFVYQE